MQNTDNIPQGYKASAGSVIPSDWEVRRLGEVAHLTSGATPLRANNSYFEGGTIPWVKTTDLNNGVLCTSEESVTQKALDETSIKILPKGTVLVAMYGGFNQIGRTAMLDMDSTINQALCALLLKKEIATPKFVLYWLNAKVSLWKNFAASSRKDPNITSRDVSHFPITLPPLAEQERIAEVLGCWDVAIEKQGALVEKLTERKRALMQQLLTAKKRLPNFSAPWQTLRLGAIGEFASAGVDKKVVDGESVIRLLNFLDVYNRDFIHSDSITHFVTASVDKIAKCQVKKGDIFFTPSSEVPTDIAISAVAVEDMDDVVYSYHIVRYRLNCEWDLNYKAYAFKTDMFFKQAQKICAGSGQRYVISQDGFRNIEIIVPPLDEQTAIAQILTTADREIEQATTKLQALRTQKRGLMQQLLSGKKRLKI